VLGRPGRIRAAEPGAVEHRQEIRRIEHAAGDQNRHDPGGHAGFHGAETQVPFAYEPRHRRDTDHTQCRNTERQGCARHAAADTVHLADLVNAQRFGIVAGGKEQGNLHDALVYQVDDTADGADRSEDGGAQRDIGDLAHGGVGEPFLQVVLKQRPGRPVYDGDGRSDAQCAKQPELISEVHAVDVVDHPHDTEGARFDHGDGVQQRAHRRGSHHRLGQPAMQRYQRRLDAETGDQQQEYHL
jgi:hypothetical protein